MEPLFRTTVRHAATWRVLAELLRRHQARDDLRVYWYFPGPSSSGIVELQRRDGAALLRLDVAVGEHLTPSLSSRRTGGVDVRWYVGALLAAEDPAQVVDAFERYMGLPAGDAVPPAGPAVRCARVLAAVLERRVLARVPVRTTPAYLDQNGHLRVSPWVHALPEVQARLARARSQPGFHEPDATLLVRHLFALHRGAGPLASADEHGEPFVIADLRSCDVHAVDGARVRDSVSLAELERAGTDAAVAAAVDWVDRRLPR